MNFINQLKWNLRESVLISAFAVGLLVLFQIYWVKPRSVKLEEVREKVASTRSKIQETKNLISNLGSRAPASEEAKTTQSLLDKYFTSNAKFSSVIMGVFSGAKDDSFSLVRMTSEKSSKVGGYTQTLYQLEAESTFISIGKFLERLEDSSLLTEVESIDISRLGSEMERCKANIRLFGYVGGVEK